MKRKSTAVTTAKNLERRFNAGENVLDYFKVERSIKRVNVDMPLWVLRGLDAEASRRGVTRQSLIKTWLVDRLDALRKEERKRSA
ncbi:MAG: CopG family transcriptional regulator [Nitrospinae bacterium]|nr:CopG family transcriptional regulator [Nitrospinota bacterium]